MAHISLSLVSHTNAGKTALARTLLGREVGVVRDAPHVTDAADVFTLIEAPDGARLLLWDTPGFGDSARLVRRLRASSNPIGWFLGHVWDRFRDRPFWNAQQAVRNLRDEADAMLYLVNASEPHAAAGYLDAELDLLAWVGKPVLVLLNQLGAPRGPVADAAEVATWRVRLARRREVRGVLPLDAFARCWVQEAALFRAVAAALPDPSARATMTRLAEVGWSARQATFEASIGLLAASLARVARDVEPVEGGGSAGARLLRSGRSLGQQFGRGVGRRLAEAWSAASGRRGEAVEEAPAGEPAAGAPADPALAAAQAALVDRLGGEVRASTGQLIALHRIEGDAEAEALVRDAGDFDARLAIDEGRAALWGGALSGALAGLKADLLAGGLTLGGGLVAGGLLGALGGAGLARGINLVRGSGGSSVGWSSAALGRLAEAAVLRYLAVAHAGRGRGAWTTGTPPPAWREAVERAMRPQRAALDAAWAAAKPAAREAAADAAGAAEVDTVAVAIAAALRHVAAGALAELYPEAPPVLRETAAAPAASSA